MTSEHPEIRPVTYTPRSSCFRTIGITFLVLFVLGIPALFLIARVAFQIPNVRLYVTCTQHAQTISFALDRYATKNGKYPQKLDELYPDYIEDKSILLCPLDKHPDGGSSYTYTRPSLDAPGDTIILTCKRHIIFPGQPPMLVAVTKDGQVLKPTAVLPAHTKR